MIYGAFGDINKLNFILTLIPVVASKSTLIWCPVLEMIFNNSVRKNILVLQDPNTLMLVEHINNEDKSRNNITNSKREFESDSRYRYYEKYVRGWKCKFKIRLFYFFCSLKLH